MDTERDATSLISQFKGAQMETEFFAEMIDEQTEDLIERFGPYDTVGKAKAMCTRQHKKTGEVMVVVEVLKDTDEADSYVNDFLWPEVETNQLAEDRKDKIDPRFLPEKIIEVGKDRVAVFSDEMNQFFNRYFLGEALRRGAKGIAERPPGVVVPRSKRQRPRDIERLKSLKGVELRRALHAAGGLR